MHKTETKWHYRVILSGWIWVYQTEKESNTLNTFNATKFGSLLSGNLHDLYSTLLNFQVKKLNLKCDLFMLAKN